MPTRDARAGVRWALVLALACLLAPPLTGLSPRSSARFSSAPRFTAVVIPSVPTAEGAFDFLRPVALNNRGQVAGTALGGGQGTSVFSYEVAFLYEPGRGSLSLDPRGTMRSSALFLNEEGRVLGNYCCGAENRYRFFLSSDPSKLKKTNRLGKGWSGWLRDDFHPTTLTDSGDIAGFSTRSRDPGAYRRLPVLNLRASGWIDLSEGDDRLQQQTSTELEVLRLNQFRDFVMPTTNDGVLGSFGGATPIQIVPPEFETTVGELSDAAEVVGEFHVPSVKYTPAGPERAFLFTPTEGLIEIHGDRFLNSRAVWITATGTVGGYATKKRESQPNDRLFTYRSSRGLRVTNLRRELHRARPKRKFGSARPIDMNDKLQFIGEIQTRKKGDPLQGPFNGEVIHFLMDPRAGLIDVQRVLDDLGLDVTIFWLVDLNDEGQVLVEAKRRSDQLRTAIVLTPK